MCIEKRPENRLSPKQNIEPNLRKKKSQNLTKTYIGFSDLSSASSPNPEQTGLDNIAQAYKQDKKKQHGNYANVLQNWKERRR